MNWLQVFFNFLTNLAKETGFDEMEYIPPQASTSPATPVPVPLAPNPPTMTRAPAEITPIDTLLPWNTTSSLSHENWHNVRVLCDLEGLSHQLKEELCATVWGESEFNIHARLDNKDKLGRVWSSDLGICQWNTHFHPEVVSLPYTPDPEKEVRAMCKMFKAGQANQWVAHLGGRYEQFMGRQL